MTMYLPFYRTICKIKDEEFSNARSPLTKFFRLKRYSKNRCLTLKSHFSQVNEMLMEVFITLYPYSN